MAEPELVTNIRRWMQGNHKMPTRAKGHFWTHDEILEGIQEGEWRLTMEECEELARYEKSIMPKEEYWQLSRFFSESDLLVNSLLNRIYSELFGTPEENERRRIKEDFKRQREERRKRSMSF
jgi:hypothetical protein